MNVVRGLLIAFLLLACFDGMLEPAWPDPGTVVATAVAPDGAAKAMLTSGKDRGHYQFEIRNPESGDTLARTTISAPLGYHEHVVSLHWAGNRRAVATIDRDFGEDNLRFSLSY
jgi:hypothetical protein